MLHEGQAQMLKHALSIGNSANLQSSQLLSISENSQVIGHESISMFVMERLRDNLQMSLKNSQAKVLYSQDNVSEKKPQRLLRESESMREIE